MEMTDGLGRNRAVAICALACLALMKGSPSVVDAGPRELPGDFKIGDHFCWFGGGGMDWRALRDPNNNPILMACLQGEGNERLKGLGIPDLRDRLARLERGNVIKKVQGHYVLAFPAVIGDKREQLQRYVEEEAAKLVPLGEQMIMEIRPHLAGREEMTYHVLWSVILDGPAWDTAKAEMLKQVHSGDRSTRDKGWLIYPPHPSSVGTNSASASGVSVRVTWSRHTPNPNAILDVITQYMKQLVPAIEQKTVVASAEARTALGKYGLVDEGGNVRLYALTSDSEASKLYTRLSHQFGQEAMTHVDMAEVTKILDASPGVAFLIVQHELCWQLLQDLAEKNVLAVPAIVAKPGTKAKEAYQLVSLTIPTRAASADVSIGSSRVRSVPPSDSVGNLVVAHGAE